MNTSLQSHFQFNSRLNLQIAYQLKISGIALLLVSVSGCSVVDSFRFPQPQARSLPKIPEIKRQAVTKPRYTQPKKVTRVQKSPVKRVTKSQSRIITNQERIAAQEQLQKQAQERAKETATVDLDPYANIPDNNSQNSVSKVETTKPEMTSNTAINSSPAVKSLMVGARADLALGKNSSAVSKLERGLRIESQNPGLWHLLSKANYSDSNYTQSITMAKKSIRYSNDDDLIAQNWALIKKAGEKSGNASAIKEALDYIKLNP